MRKVDDNENSVFKHKNLERFTNLRVILAQGPWMKDDIYHLLSFIIMLYLIYYIYIYYIIILLLLLYYILYYYYIYI